MQGAHPPEDNSGFSGGSPPLCVYTIFSLFIHEQTFRLFLYLSQCEEHAGTHSSAHPQQALFIWHGKYRRSRTAEQLKSQSDCSHITCHPSLNPRYVCLNPTGKLNGDVIGINSGLLVNWLFKGKKYPNLSCLPVFMV